VTLLVGWKQIAEACGGLHWRTVKKKARKYHMPLVYLDGRPTVTREALRLWWIELHKESPPKYSDK